MTRPLTQLTSTEVNSVALAAIRPALILVVIVVSSIALPTVRYWLAV
jgi:hypothetical protein